MLLWFQPLLPLLPFVYCFALLVVVVATAKCFPRNSHVLNQVRGFEQIRACPPYTLHTFFVRQARVSLEGVSLSLTDIRIVDGKFACYRITVTPARGAGWEVRLGWDLAGVLSASLCVCVDVASGGICVGAGRWCYGAASCCRGHGKGYVWPMPGLPGVVRHCCTTVLPKFPMYRTEYSEMSILCTLHAVLGCTMSSIGYMVHRTPVHSSNSTTVPPADAVA